MHGFYCWVGIIGNEFYFRECFKGCAPASEKFLWTKRKYSAIKCFIRIAHYKQILHSKSEDTEKDSLNENILGKMSTYVHSMKKTAHMHCNQKMIDSFKRGKKLQKKK